MNVNHLASGIVKALSVNQLADFLNLTVSADSVEGLSDEEFQAVCDLHDVLCDMSPEAVEIAQRA